MKQHLMLYKKQHMGCFLNIFHVPYSANARKTMLTHVLRIKYSESETIFILKNEKSILNFTICV